STGWHNSVRAREYLHDAATETGDVPDPDLRVLEMLKNNQGKKADSILLRWRDGVYVPEPSGGSLEALAADQRADEVFLAILHRLDREGRNVNHKPGPSFAPSIMAAEPEGKGVGRKRLGEAMRRLFMAGKIRVADYGRPSRPYHRIVAA